MKRRYTISGRVTVGVSIDVMIDDDDLEEMSALDLVQDADATSLVEVMGDSRGRHLAVDGGLHESLNWWLDGCYIEFDDAEKTE